MLEYVHEALLCLAVFRDKFQVAYGNVLLFSCSPDPEPSKEVADVFKCIAGVFVASNLHMKMGKTSGQSISSEHFGIPQLWEFFCQPFGENAFLKKAPKTENENLNKLHSF